MKKYTNLVSRGSRMIPLAERYLREEPSSLLHEYPRRLRLERETTVGHLEEDLKFLHTQAGVRQQESSKASQNMENFVGSDSCRPELTGTAEFAWR